MSMHQDQNQKVLLQSQYFELPIYLQKICKKQHFYQADQQKDKFQIDFIALQKDLKLMQGLQERTCEQVVQFVDQHRQRFIQINTRFTVIEDKVKESENLLKLLGSSIEQYKTGCYLNQSRIQTYINDYEYKLLQQQMLKISKNEALFMLRFNSQFQDITNKQVSKLNITQKYIISRFTYKLEYFRSLYNHPIIINFVPDNLQILEIIINLREQLSKYQSMMYAARQANEKKKIMQALNLIKGWYVNLGKKEEYFKVLEKNTIEKEINLGQKLLVSNKTSLLSGKDSHIMDNVFTKVLEAVYQFPQNYPQDRLQNIIFSFFRKEQLKFLYTYAMPIFPLAYSSYLSAIQNSKVLPWLKSMLRDYHGWNLKMWVIVREKNILDRSNNDNDMFKWVEIIFKSNCMLPGTLTDFVKLAFKLINRYLSKLLKSDFSLQNFSKLIQHHSKLGQLIQAKITQNLKTPDLNNISSLIKQNINYQTSKVIKQLLSKNINNIALTCQSSLQPVKSFVSKIIKKDKQFVLNNTINKHQNLFRPLYSYLKNNSQINTQASNFIIQFVEGVVVKYYDSHYAVDIYTYSKDQLISQQVSSVMEVVGRQRTTLFKNYNHS